MADLDLTEAVNAAARAAFLPMGEKHDVAWGDLSPVQQHAWRESALPLVTAAAPLIAAQVRAETLTEAADLVDALSDEEFWEASEHLRAAAIRRASQPPQTDLLPCPKCGADGWSYCRDRKGEPLPLDRSHVDRRTS